MCYEFSLFSNLSRVARFYIDGVSGSEKYAVDSAVSRTSDQAAWHLFVLSVDHQTESFEVQSAKIGYWPHIDDTKHFLYFWFPMSYFSKASSTCLNCLLFPNIYFFIKDHIYLSLWEVFAHSQKFLNSKERRLIHKLSTVALIPFSRDGELLHEWVKVESFSI